jgi:hypothetical protein
MLTKRLDLYPQICAYAQDTPSHESGIPTHLKRAIEKHRKFVFLALVALDDPGQRAADQPWPDGLRDYPGSR